MNSTVDEITRSTGKLSLFDCSTDELKQLVNQYPFFAPAKFLLARKMKEKNSFLYEEQVQHVSIYFQNPAWFNHVLHENAEYETYRPVAPVHESLPEPAAEAPEIATIPPIETPAPPAIEEPATFEEVVDQTVPAEATLLEETGTVEEDIVEENEAAPADQPALDVALPKFNFEPVDPAKAQLTFEPYHTVDYFASQGISAKEEEDKPKDKLARQLKSFTEWIRTMKRLPESEITAGVSATDEKKVEKMAEVSIHDREVVTEAMAEVWVMQGNAVKATEIYQKLSLLNPGKSSYFAAKIEQLKHL